MKIRFSPSSLGRVVPSLALGASFALVHPAFAQDTASAAAPVAATPALPTLPVLSIGLPPQAKLIVDVDARDGELLSMVKSLASGFDASSLYNLGISQGNTTAAAALPREGRDWNNEAFVQLMANVDFTSLLQDINHMRMVVFVMPPGSGPRALMTESSSVMGYYEDAYITREGGHRVAKANLGPMQILGVGFPQGGFGLIIQTPGTGVVLRSDGYPNFKSVGPLAMAMFLRSVPPAK